jgi:hypothetical protein
VLALELQTGTVLGLTAVRATSLLLLLLIPAQAGAQLDIDAGWGGEAEALGYLDQVELVHVEHGAEGVGGVGLEV